MSKQIDSAKLTTVDVKPYVKPTLVKGPVLGSVTALTKNISGFTARPERLSTSL